jgi:hypothetical protein
MQGYLSAASLLNLTDAAPRHMTDESIELSLLHKYVEGKRQMNL